MIADWRFRISDRTANNNTNRRQVNEELKIKAGKIKLLLSDCDGVLTDGCVYYSDKGEELKKFSLRDGMGVERLRNLCQIDTGIMTKENSQIVARRAEKLKISHLYLGVQNKREQLYDILKKHSLQAEEVAYIGDDTNDLDIIQSVGFSACPSDAIPLIKQTVDYICSCPGGQGAFRELAELIIELKTQN